MEFYFKNEKHEYNIYNGHVDGEPNKELAKHAEMVRERVKERGFYTYESFPIFKRYIDVLDENEKNELFHEYLDNYYSVSETIRNGKLRNNDFLRVLNIKAKYERMLYYILES